MTKKKTPADNVSAQKIKFRHAMLAVSLLETNNGQIDGLPRNPRLIKDNKFKALQKSVGDDPDMLEIRPVVVVPHGDKYVILGGNMRTEAARANGQETVPCIVIDQDTPLDWMREFVIKDNGDFGEWDWDMLANEWDDMDFATLGVDVPTNFGNIEEDDEVERKSKEFAQRMSNGEDLSEDDEYLDFLEKFKAKKTTDDCYTPEQIYNAVAAFVCEEYNVDRKDFERPFYPGGDYKKHIYPNGCVVVDNPPFSILAEILQFYKERNIRFFLFAPTLTLFSSSSSSTCTALPIGVGVTYENGASVNTSFLTNLDDKEVRFRSCPRLYRIVNRANEEVQKALHKELPKYTYPDNVVTSSFVSRLSRYGVDFSMSIKESESVSSLDSQREKGKAIYGKGFLISEKAAAEKAAAEKAAAEKAAAEKAAATRWTLSDRELEIIKKLSS